MTFVLLGVLLSEIVYWPRPPIRQQKKKLQRLWTGPWQIISFITPLVVKIRHVTNNKTQTVHIDRLAPCRNQSEPFVELISRQQVCLRPGLL